MNRLRLNEQSGFTLLELLMVVIIIAILAAIALPQYLRVAERSRSTEALNIMRSIRDSEQAYRGEDPAGDYTQDFFLLTTDLPGIQPFSRGGGPGQTTIQTANWTITVNGTASAGNGPNVVAVRSDATGAVVAGQAAGAIDMKLNTGLTCAPVGNMWGLLPPRTGPQGDACP